MKILKQCNFSPAFLGLGILALSLTVSGCQVVRGVTPRAGSAKVRGSVHGGSQPIAGATIQLYAMGQMGNSSPAQPLLAQAVTTSATGAYSIAGDYTCPSSTVETYVVATGGVSFVGGTPNPAISLIAMLGPCGQLSDATPFEINEVTTVAATYALRGYMSSASQVGAQPGSTSLPEDLVKESQLVDEVTGTSPGPGVPAGAAVQVSKLYALADILVSCVNSPGGVAGDGSPCGNLFALVHHANNGQAYSDTLSAALAIQHSPSYNAGQIYALLPATNPFTPTLSSAPVDWTLPLVPLPAAPSTLPGAGSYPAGQLVTLQTSTAGATIYYTTDGTQPTAASQVYNGPFALSASETVKAIAMVNGVSSPVATTSYTLTTLRLAFSTQPSNVTLDAPMTPPPSVSVVDAVTGKASSARTTVTLTLAGPGNASLLGQTQQVAVNGVATFPGLSLSGIGTGFFLKASAQGVPAVSSTSFQVTGPALAVTLPNSSPIVGTSFTGLVKLSTPAVGPVIVSVSSSSSALSITPASLTIASGATSGSFTYKGVAAASSTLTVAATGYTGASVLVTPVAAKITAAPATIPASLFGLSVLNYYSLTPTMKFGTARTWDAYPNLDWSEANPSAGVFQFQWLDHFIALNQARGADIIYTLGRTPHWASSQPNNTASSYGPGECAPPASMNDYDAYLKALVTHEAGKIKYYELWNEPQSTQMYCGTVQAMVTMAQHASQIIKSIDPNALIVSPGVTGGPGPAWLGSFLSQGGGSYVDVIGFHGYWSAKAEDLLSVVQSYKTVMSSNGVAALPMFDTEASWAGFGNVGTLSAATQASYVAKTYLLHWSQGVSRFVWYAYDGGTWGGMLSSAGIETTAATAYKQVYRWMVGASLSTPCAQAKTGVWTCGLTRANGYAAQAVWLPNSTGTYTVPSGFTQYLDLTGAVHPITGTTVTIGDQPILLETDNSI